MFADVIYGWPSPPCATTMMEDGSIADDEGERQPFLRYETRSTFTPHGDATPKIVIVKQFMALNSRFHTTTLNKIFNHCTGCTP